jgi:hypothetical protein
MVNTVLHKANQNYKSDIVGMFRCFICLQILMLLNNSEIQL